MKKTLIYLLINLFFIAPSHSKDLFEYLKSDQPPPLILGHIDFDKALNKEISDLSIYLGMSKNKKPINETFFWTLRNGSASHDEININDDTENLEYSLEMNINNWYHNPHTMNLAPAIMMDMPKQIQLMSNGMTDVVTIQGLLD